MDKEKFRNFINVFTADPNAHLAEVQDFMGEMDEVFDSVVTLTAKAAEQDNKIRDLQNTNIKLFLSQTGGRQETEQEEQELSLEEFAKQMVGKE